MRYSLTFHQLGLVENGLGDLPIQAALLLDYLNVFFFSCAKLKRITFEGEEFAWIDLQTAADDLPMLAPSSQVDSSPDITESERSKRSKVEKFSRWISCLRNFKLIATRRGDNGRLHYRPTPLAASIMVSRSGNGVVAENRNAELRKTARRNALGNIREQYNKNREDEDFEQFWKIYPSKKAKQAARRAWAKTATNRPPISKLISILKLANDDPQWAKDDGNFVPHGATWLNGHRWEDFEQHPSEQADEIPEPIGDWHTALMRRSLPDRTYPKIWKQLTDYQQRYAREFLAEELKKAKAA
ncbi:MAG: hypothetical protein WCQ16_06255 [Verrucomicrobiae bacterium]